MASVSRRKWTYKGVEKEAWVVRYLDEKDVYRSKQFDMKRQADAFRKQVEREMHEGVHVPSEASVTVKVACEEYLRIAEQRVRDGRIGKSRLHNLRWSFDGGIVPIIGNKLMRELREADVAGLYNALVDSGRMKPVSARNHLHNLGLVEAFSKKRGYMKADPVAVALRDLRGIRRDPIRTFQVEEVAKLLELAGERAHWAHERTAAYLNCFVNIAAFCGLRRGEIGALTLDRVDLERRVIEVRNNLTDLKEIKGPKTRAGIRDVPMPRRVVEVVRAWVAKHYVPNDKRLIFAHPSGTATGLRSLHMAWTKLLKRAELYHDERPFHFHALRHFYASMIIEAGTPLADVASLLGHSTFDMTLQVYTHSVIKPAGRSEFVDRMAGRVEAANDARIAQKLLTA